MVSDKVLPQVKWREEIEAQFQQMRVEASALPELDDEVQAARRREEELRWGGRGEWIRGMQRSSD